jgi:hypothetical protein
MMGDRMPQATLTILNTYRLIGTVEDFSVAIAALAARVEAEGHPNVLSYRFFVSAAHGQARAVIDYADAAAWIGHHDISMTWPEMQALHRAASLSHVTFLGTLTDEIRAWLSGSGLKADIDSGYSAVAGFVRS